MARVTSPSLFDEYSPMGNNRPDYEACYEYSESLCQGGTHCHDFYEFYIHYQGGQYIGVDNQVYELKPNQLIIMLPFSVHGIYLEQQLYDYERGFLYITEDMLRHVGCDQVNLADLFRTTVENGHNQFQLSDEAAQKSKELLRLLKIEQYENSPLKNFRQYTHVMELLDIVCECIEQSTDTPKPVKLDSTMQKILTYVNENYSSPITVKEIARKFNISVSYLSHEFSRYTSRSVYEYILYRRVMLAKQMIYTGQSFSSICAQCGFPDYSNFLRMFKKYTGLSPSQYRDYLTSKGVGGSGENG